MPQITAMVKELFIIAILAPVALQTLVVSANWTGIGVVVVNIFTVVLPMLFGVAAALKWLGKI